MDEVEQSQEEEVEDTISPTARSYRPTVAYTSSGRRVVVAGGRTVGRSDTSDASAPLGKKSLSSTADDVASKGEDLIKEALDWEDDETWVAKYSDAKIVLDMDAFGEWFVKQKNRNAAAPPPSGGSTEDDAGEISYEAGRHRLDLIPRLISML